MPYLRKQELAFQFYYSIPHHEYYFISLICMLSVGYYSRKILKFHVHLRRLLNVYSSTSIISMTMAVTILLFNCIVSSLFFSSLALTYSLVVLFSISISSVFLTYLIYPNFFNKWITQMKLNKEKINLFKIKSENKLIKQIKHYLIKKNQ